MKLFYILTKVVINISVGSGHLRAFLIGTSSIAIWLFWHRQEGWSSSIEDTFLGASAFDLYKLFPRLFKLCAPLEVTAVRL